MPSPPGESIFFHRIKSTLTFRVEKKTIAETVTIKFPLLVTSLNLKSYTILVCKTEKKMVLHYFSKLLSVVFQIIA